MVYIIDSERLDKFINAQYGIAGEHSAVQICSWTKKALRDQGVCYKQKFYGVDCHRCAQMSPAFAWCHESCIHCWRPAEWMTKLSFEKVDEPEYIIQETVKARRKLVGGIGGAADVNKQLFRETLNTFPSHWAISLSGEPTIYPKICGLVEELRKHKEVKSIFIVTNGQEPGRIKEMADKGCLPTQLYVSVIAPNEDEFKKLNKSVYEDGWQRLVNTLNMLGSLDCRTVIRLTVMKAINDSEDAIKEFAGLFEESGADFIEVKAYMYLGLSRQRLKKENMPFNDYVEEFSEMLSALLPSYHIEDRDDRSRIVLFKRNDSKVDNIIRGPVGK